MWSIYSRKSNEEPSSIQIFTRHQFFLLSTGWGQGQGQGWGQGWESCGCKDGAETQNDFSLTVIDSSHISSNNSFHSLYGDSLEFISHFNIQTVCLQTQTFFFIILLWDLTGFVSNSGIFASFLVFMSVSNLCCSKSSVVYIEPDQHPKKLQQVFCFVFSPAAN